MNAQDAKLLNWEIKAIAFGALGIALMGCLSFALEVSRGQTGDLILLGLVMNGAAILLLFVADALLRMSRAIAANRKEP